MAALWMDGFEIDFADDTAGIWTAVVKSSTPTLSYQGSLKRTGGGALRCLSSTKAKNIYLSQTLASTYTEVYGGFGFRWASTTALDEGHAGSGVTMLALLSSGGSAQLSMTLDQSTNALRIYRGTPNDNVLLGSSSAAVTTDAWHYIEFHFLISDTVGVVQLKIDSTLVLDLSSQDTNVANTDIKTVQFGIPPAGGTPATNAGGGACDFYYDDFIINDTTGTVSNSWPNGAGIEKLVPNADGNYTAWTSTGGAVDYTEVDDVTTYGNLPDDDTTTILSSTTGQRTSVNLTNTTLAGSVEAVMLCTYSKNSAAGADQMGQFVRIGSTDYDSTAYVPATTYGWQKDILTLNPATSARWLTSAIDGMEQGWKRVT